MNDDVKQKIKMTGWMSAAVGISLLAIVCFCHNFRCSFVPGLVGLSFLVAGAALIWGERSKSAILLAFGGLLFLLFDGCDFFTKMILFVLLYAGVIFYFKPTRLNKVTISTVVNLVILLSMTDAIRSGFLLALVRSLIAIFQLVLAAHFISRKYLFLEDIILKYEEKTSIPYLLKTIGGFLKTVGGFIGKYLFKFIGKIGGPVGAKMLRQYEECGSSLQKFCLSYAYSIFVLGLILAAVFILLASPTKNVKGWDHGLLEMAVAQFVGCVIGGCFVLSQISCSIKLRGRQIVAGSAPWHLLFVSVLCWILSVVVVVGIVYLFCNRKVEADDGVINWTLALIDVKTLLAVAIRWRDLLKAAITFSAVITIWHLIGCGFVALLIRDNIAKVLSLENVDDPKTEGREAMKEADAAAQQQA